MTTPRRRARLPAACGTAAAVAASLLLLAACVASDDGPVGPTATGTSAAPTQVPAPTPTTAKPSATATTTPSPQPTGGLQPGRTLVWSDEFDGPSGAVVSDRSWRAQEGGGGWGNEELEVYTSRPENVSTTGTGALAITARKDPPTGAPQSGDRYTSARIVSVPAFRYGHIEARIKVPAGAGLWPAFWSLGGDGSGKGWPSVGEIDVMETINQAVWVRAGVTGPDATGSPWGTSGDLPSSSGSLATDWHVYAVDWSADALAFSMDGQVYETVRRSDLSAGQQWVFDSPFHLILNLAVGGAWPGDPAGDLTFPATMLVDYVRAYDSEVSGLG